MSCLQRGWFATRFFVAMIALIFVAALRGRAQEKPLAAPEGGRGIAAKYPGDVGFEKDPHVVFVENIEVGDIEEIGQSWGHLDNKNGKPLNLVADTPAGSTGKRSLQISATRGRYTGRGLFKVFKPGYDQLYCRFYVKFAADHGYVNHFVSLQGSVNPPSWPEGGAGHRHDNDFTTGLEPMNESRHEYPGRPFPPPGIWHFYTYWPEMRSWQNVDGSGTSFYGNNFEPKQPAVVPRDLWVCVEFMVKMNSTPDKSDGEQAFWIDGKLAGRFAPGSVTGYWMRSDYRLDDEKGNPFEGMRWRKDTRVNVNKLWLLHYVNWSEGTGAKNDAFAAKQPDAKINNESAAVWFDDIVVSSQYVGPIWK
jgi:hypothetical protein